MCDAASLVRKHTEVAIKTRNHLLSGHNACAWLRICNTCRSEIVSDNLAPEYEMVSANFEYLVTIWRRRLKQSATIPVLGMN